MGQKYKMNLTCLTAKYGIATEVSGHAKTCCLANQRFTDESGKLMTFDEHGPREIWNSLHRKEILDALDSGIQHPNCTVCWQEEAVGRPSKRLRESAFWESFVGSDSETPLYLDLKLGNTCNLRCRTCNSHNSSSWMSEEYEVEYSNKLTKSEFFSQYEGIRKSYSEENEELWSTLAEWLPKTVKIDFYGGEPFLIEKPWKLLYECVKTGVSKNQYLHCNTNTTIFPSPEQEEVLTNFKEVDLSLSIDGIGDVFEYMRYPAKWNLVLENIDKFFELSKRHKNIKITFCYTISAINIHHIVEFDKFVRDRYGMDVSIWYNMLFWPEKQKITNLPEEIKNLISSMITEHISSYKEGNSYYFDGLRSVIGLLYIEPPNLKKLSEFFSYTDVYDKHRNQKFSDYFPEWSKLLNQYK